MHLGKDIGQLKRIQRLEGMIRDLQKAQRKKEKN